MLSTLQNVVYHDTALKQAKQADLVFAGGHEGIVALKADIRVALGGGGPGQIGVIRHACKVLAGEMESAAPDINPHGCTGRPHLFINRYPSASYGPLLKLSSRRAISTSDQPCQHQMLVYWCTAMVCNKCSQAEWPDIKHLIAQRVRNRQFRRKWTSKSYLPSSLSEPGIRPVCHPAHQERLTDGVTELGVKFCIL